jgi:hypothetical protein
MGGMWRGAEYFSDASSVWLVTIRTQTEQIRYGRVDAYTFPYW